MIELARTLFRHRGLLATLTARELKGRYRGSALGFLWSLVQPLLLLAVYSAVFGLVFSPRAGSGPEPYPLFLVCGLFPWIWFATALGEGTVSLIANSGLIRRAVFPAELLPMVPVLANLVHLLLALPVLAGGLLIGRAMGQPVERLGRARHAARDGARAAADRRLRGRARRPPRPLQGRPRPADQRAHSALLPDAGALPAGRGAATRRSRWWCKLSPATPFTLAYQEALFAGRFPAPALWLQMAAWAVAGFGFGAVVFRRLRETLVEAV